MPTEYRTITEIAGPLIFVEKTAWGATLAAGLKSPSEYESKADEDPLGVRDDFPALREQAFLNTAYIGLIPQAVVDAGHDWLEARQRRTRSATSSGVSR